MEGLFSLGSNGSGQLGIGHKEDVSVPKQVKFHGGEAPMGRIVKVTAGGNHTVLLTESGRAYWSGDPSDGACGIVAENIRAEKQSSVFRELVLSTARSLGPIVHVACTWNASIFVLRDEQGKTTQLYTCGVMGTEIRTAGEPTFLDGFPPPGTEIKDVAAGFRHVVIVLDNGDVYGWGNGRKGQIGSMEDVQGRKSILNVPRKIQGVDFNVFGAVCCQYATCLIAEPGDGRITVLGADKWNLISSAPVEEPNWKAMTASWGGIYILRRDGTVVAWGRDDHRQLPPPGLPRLTTIVAGSEHVLALTEAGELLAWGWGEHGNCGPDTEHSGDVKERWNVLASLKNLPDGSTITFVGAGCATTWIDIATDGLFL